MADQPTNLDELLCTPNFGSYDNDMATRIANKATGWGFDVYNLGMMGVKTLNSMFSEYTKKSRANAPIFFGN